MNHRQWKKNFKKVHGRNPNCWEDKRKKIRYSSQVIYDSLAKIPQMVAEAYGTLFLGLSKACDRLSEAMKNIADACMNIVVNKP